MYWKVEPTNCQICSNDSYVSLFHNDSHGFGLHTVICSTCGLVYLNPRPTAAEYQRLYTGIYEKLFYSAWNPKVSDLVALKRVKRYSKYLGHDVFEVGPGDGAFLASIEKTCSVSGIDPSHLSVEACRKRGLNVTHGYFSGSSQQFDSIAAFHVLEHALEPIKLLNAFRSALKPGGFLLLEVPNILGEWKNLGMIHIAHPCQYSPFSLKNALSMSGFSPVAIEAIEEHPFESSIRVIAQPGPPSPFIAAPNGLVDQTQRLFNSRLVHWKKDLAKFRIKRSVLELKRRLAF